MTKTPYLAHEIERARLLATVNAASETYLKEATFENMRALRLAQKASLKFEKHQAKLTRVKSKRRAGQLTPRKKAVKAKAATS